MNNHFNPFSKITERDFEENAGKTFAIDIETGDILVVRQCVEVLQHVMRTLYPGVRYARLTLPERVS